MSKICAKCGKDFDDLSIADEASQKYPSCPTCWAEWHTYSIMVINELRLDMSLSEHRKALHKQERMFFGLEKPEELQKNPESKEQDSSLHP
ncbi:MAG TPA: Fe(2+)-trafficking protein [Nitrososphaeraceae archaeon]|jgi:Fe-S cluster biosynthesis and repair protein YggX|nr:Fe(2+)-trafficking protein [Nitrososphaeraceae archaeon]